jgi:hypothetical protein
VVSFAVGAVPHKVLQASRQRAGAQIMSKPHGILLRGHGVTPWELRA